MIESDTIKLLRECDAGVKMGIDSISEVCPEVESKEMLAMLNKCKDKHQRLQKEIECELSRFQDDGKNPNPIAKSMSSMKTNLKMAMKHCDKTVADLMTDGCNMGVKSLSKYLNEYKAAEEYAKDITKKLIAIEDTLAHELRGYL